MIDLKPCPFCGDRADTDYEGGGPFVVHCTSCGAEVTESDWQRAVFLWNTRSPQVPTAERSDPELRAREVLAAEYVKEGLRYDIVLLADPPHSIDVMSRDIRCALRAIEAALRDQRGER